MKNIGLFMLLCVLLTSAKCYGEPQQTVTNEQAYGIINLEKAPASENKQQIKNTKSWFCINIIINGKIKDETNHNTEY